MRITSKKQLQPGDTATIPRRFPAQEHRGKHAVIESISPDYGYGLKLRLRFDDGTTFDCTTDDISPTHFWR